MFVYFKCKNDKWKINLLQKKNNKNYMNRHTVVN